MHQMKNYMEQIVLSAMEEILKDINVCNCERCRYDIAAKL